MKLRQNHWGSVDIPASEIRELDDHFRQPGSGWGLVKLGAIVIGLIASGNWVIKKVTNNNQRKESPQNFPSKGENAKSIDNNPPSVPLVPLSEHCHEESNPETELKHRIAELLTGESTVEFSTNEDLANVRSENVMQDVLVQGFNLVVAEKKSGKTVFAMQLAVALTKGEQVDFLPKGEVVRQTVFYLDSENGLGEFKNKFDKRIAGVFNKDLFHGHFGPDVSMQTILETMAEKVVTCSAKDITFVLDCVYDYTVEETKVLQRKVRVLVDNSKKLYDRNVTVIAIVHRNDNGTLRGSGTLGNAAKRSFELIPFFPDEVDKKKGKTGERPLKDGEQPEFVNISYNGRGSKVGKRTCRLLGVNEGYAGNTHFKLVPRKYGEVKKDNPKMAEKIRVEARSLYDLAQGDNDNQKYDWVAQQIKGEYAVEVSRQNITSWVKPSTEEDSVN